MPARPRPRGLLPAGGGAVVPGAARGATDTASAFKVPAGARDGGEPAGELPSHAV
jgi:hypothetical protein